MDAITLALAGAAESSLIPRGSAVLLAVSGGADSMALLYGAAEAAKETGWRLSVGHVHHGWRPREGERELAFVAGHARAAGAALLLPADRCAPRLLQKLLPPIRTTQVSQAGLRQVWHSGRA